MIEKEARLKVINLSRLEEIKDLRTVWPHEALDFTPWLSQDDNISLLADAVGMDITVDETESSVGDFNVDIFASETGTDRKIIIENQLEDTNHDHLGKLITYASGKSADVVIWVVKHAREEHKAAIEWLNNHTDDNVGFFLCEIKLYRIGSSEPGPLSNYIRDYFDRKFPEEEMQKLANSKESKVPFDAQDNRHTTIRVEGLSAYYHRLLQLGHDPVLGFVFGVADILTGRMTTIDKNGKVVSQVMENYAERKETEIFKALAKQIAHFKSDVTTSMGLPVPFMSLFNLLQFGNIGEYDQTIAEIVQGMYYEGYDFIHFCSMSIPTMLVEVIVRMGYAFKRISEGYSIKDSIPVSLNREKHPKLATMLFLGHSAATAVNAGKVTFSENPMAINYPQWIAFTKYSYSQLKWAVMEKPSMREAYVSGKIYEEMQKVFDEVENTFEEYTRDKIVIYS